MSPQALFSQALQLQKPWSVTDSQLQQDERGLPAQLSLKLDFEKGSRFACPCCQKPCAVHDTQTKRWKHLNFWQYPTILEARTPRVTCPGHGVKLVDVPWARKESGFTLLFEAFVLMLAADCPVKKISEITGEHDTRLWRIIGHYTDVARLGQPWQEVKQIAVDETSTRKGHAYATVVVDLSKAAEGQRARFLFMTPGKDSGCVEQFAQEMPLHGAQPSQIDLVAMDMSPAWKKAVPLFLPMASMVFDRFHVMQWAGKAVDVVRRELAREGADLKGAMWILRGNEGRLTEEQRARRLELCKRHTRLGRAMALREGLQEIWELDTRDEAETHLNDWYRWARRCRIPAFKDLALSIGRHWEGILNFFPGRVTSAAIEAINGLIQSAKRMARGYRSFTNLRAIAFLKAGRLELAMPRLC